MKEYIEKADILIEALPYIQSFKDKVVVIKYGGTVVLNNRIREKLFQDIVFLNTVGIKPVIVHGGRSLINTEIEKTGRTSRFNKGIRVTDKEDVKIIVRVLEDLNNSIVQGLRRFNGRAKGFTINNNFIKAESVSEELGYVGRILEIETSPIRSMLNNGFIPVISPLGKGRDGKIYNINADQVSSELAVALHATKLVLLTHVDGVLKDSQNDQTLISSIDVKEIEELIEVGIVKDGMIPKVRAGCYTVLRGVDKVHIINGNISHALLLEIFTTKGIGTQILSETTNLHK